MDDEDKNSTPKKRKVDKKRGQKYTITWEKEFKWLTNDPENSSNAKCKICGVVFCISSAGIGHIKQHQETKMHKSKTELKKSSGVLDKFLTPTTSSSSEVSDRDNTTASELALAFHTVKHNLSYNSMDCTVKLNKIIYVDSSAASSIHLARTKMEALVSEVLGPYALQQVIHDLNNENVYFCLQTDASNKKNIKLFPLVVQYFTAKNGIENKLIDFYENSNESANGMFQAIQESMALHKLSFDKISGLSADNTNANFGVNHSLFTNMKELIPNLIKGNCHAHIVHNCMRHSMNFLSYDIENVILKIYSHFSHSAVRRENLKRFVESVDGNFQELKRHVGTRWLSLLPCIDTVLFNWKPIKSYFLSLGDDCPMVLQNLLCLNNIDVNYDLIEIYLKFCSHVLNLFNKTVKCLEGNNITILDVYNIINMLKKDLIKRKEDCFFGFETMKMLRLVGESSLELKDRICKNFTLFIDKALLYLEKWFDYSNENVLCSLSNFNLNSPISFQNVENVISLLNIQHKLNIDMDSLYSELIILNELYLKVIQDNKDFTNLSTAEKWQYIFNHDNSNDFPNTLNFISYILSVPATSAFTERVFSVMNAKWRDERNRASINLIKNELIIYFNLKIECKEAFNTFKQDKGLLNIAKSNKKYVFKS